MLVGTHAGGPTRDITADTRAAAERGDTMTPDSLAPVSDAAWRDEASAQAYRRLAIRVLARAWLDATGPGSSTTERESARSFLAGSGMLFHWCRVAALDPSWVVERVERLDRRTQ
jgi:hypothetical protein